jgi:hypothetical protein
MFTVSHGNRPPVGQVNDERPRRLGGIGGAEWFDRHGVPPARRFAC